MTAETYSQGVLDLIREGTVWRCKRRGEGHRTLHITGVDDERQRVYVARNTSRRTQSIGFATLVKDYGYDREASR